MADTTFARSLAKMEPEMNEPIEKRLREAGERVVKFCFHDGKAVISIPRKETDVDAVIYEAASVIAEMREALEPFAEPKGYTKQKDYLKIYAGPHQWDMRWKLTLGDFRKAAAALKRAGRAE